MIESRSVVSETFTMVCSLSIGANTHTHTEAPTHKHITVLSCQNPWPCADIPGGPVCVRDIQLSALSDLMCHLLGAICQTHVSP